MMKRKIKLTQARERAARAIIEWVRCPETKRLVVRGTDGVQGITCLRTWIN